jgi:protein kinase C substrate 80K-H
LADLENIDGIDFGVGNVWEKLYKTCIELDTPEYTYELCLFDTATQKPKSGGGSDIPIGTWSKWTDGKMVYEGGAQCWNGPKRSVKVDVECGDVNEAVSMSEASKCEYVMRVRSPAGCEDMNRHDELYLFFT